MSESPPPAMTSAYDQQTKKLIDHIQAGRLNPKAMITHRVPLEDIGDAYHIFSAKLDGCIKPVLLPNGA